MMHFNTMPIKKGGIVSYRIVIGRRVVAEGVVVDPLNFGFSVEIEDFSQSDLQVGYYENGRFFEPGNVIGDL